MKLLTTVPFSGFYESIHSEAIDNVEYAKAYVREMSTGLEFDSLDSPEYYNFSTDRIFAKISLENAQALLNNVDKDRLKEVCKEHFTSYDGFISHYDTDWKQWGEIQDWDHNQLGALLESFLDEDIEEQIYEVLRSNGYIEYPEDDE